MEIKRTQEEIDAVLSAAQKEIDYQYLADTFHAQGVKAALVWITGQTDDNPMED